MGSLEGQRAALESAFKQQKNPVPIALAMGAKKGAELGASTARKVAPVVAEAGADMARWGLGKLKSLGSGFAKALRKNPRTVSDMTDEAILQVLDEPYSFGIGQDPEDRHLYRSIETEALRRGLLKHNPPTQNPKREWVYTFTNGEKKSLMHPIGDSPDDKDLELDEDDPLLDEEIADISPADGKCWNCGGVGCFACSDKDETLEVPYPNPHIVDVSRNGGNQMKVEEQQKNPPVASDAYSSVVDPTFRPSVPQAEHNPKAKTMFGAAKSPKYAQIIKTTSVAEARESVKKLSEEWSGAATRDKKRRLKMSATLAANRMKAMRKKKNLHPDTKKEKAEIEKIYRVWIKAHTLPRKNPQGATASVQEEVADDEDVVEPTATAIINPPEPEDESQNDGEETAEEEPAETPAEPEVEETEEKQEEPPAEPEKPVENPVCQHELKYLGRGNPKGGGETLDIYKCLVCQKTFARQVSE